jgi:dihydroxy-acid dehydratase
VTPCNAHFRELAEHVKAGVLEAGGFRSSSVMSLGGPVAPDDDLFRNQVSMDVEVDPRESVRRRRADDGLRQDDAGAPDGRRVVDLRRSASRAADAQRQVPRRGRRLRHARGRSAKLKTGEFKESDLVEAEACQSRSAGPA